MLPGGDESELTELLQTLPCRVAIPDWYRALIGQRGPVPSSPDDRREFARFHYPTMAILEHSGNLPSLLRSSDPYVVLLKDLSRGGVAFLHEGPLYPSEQISLWLPIGRKTYRVRRCRRHQEQCYEIGAR